MKQVLKNRPIGKPGMRKDQIPSRRRGSGKKKKIEIERPGMEPALSPSNFEALCLYQEVPQAGGSDAGVSGDHLI